LHHHMGVPQIFAKFWRSQRETPPDYILVTLACSVFAKI